MEVEDFPNNQHIIWEYGEEEQELSSVLSLNKKEAERFIRKKKKEGYRLK